MSADSNLGLIKRVPLFSLLTESDAQAVATRAARRTFKRGESLFRHGQRADVMHILLTGRVRVMSWDGRGREVILGMVKPLDCVGEMSMLEGEPHAATARADIETDTLALSRYDFKDLLPASGTLSHALMRGVIGRLRQADRQIESLALLSVHQRVSQALYDLAESIGGQQVIAAKVKRQHLANMVGASREMVSRVMKDLEECGDIQSRDDGSVLIQK